MVPGSSAAARKRHRVGCAAVRGGGGQLSPLTPDSDGTIDQEGTSQAMVPAGTASSPAISAQFNDPSTADVVLRLQLEVSPVSSGGGDDYPLDLDLHLHSSALVRSRYFAALLSDRWCPSAAPRLLTLKIHSTPDSTNPFGAHLAVLQLLYSLDFNRSILSVSDALDMLPVALELLFDDCVRSCIRFLEAVPWTEEEEESVLGVIPFLRDEESTDLIARINLDSLGKPYSEEMLHGLIHSAIHSHPKVANVKALVAQLIREYPFRDSVQRVLDHAFTEVLETLKELLGDYASPDFRVAGGNDETEAIQRLSLHAAVVNARQLLWLVERMIELHVADTAVKEWSEQAALAADLQKTFRDDAGRNIAPGLSSFMMRCTSKLANAVTAGTVLASRQVRMKLVKDWLPVLNVCRDIVSPIPSGQQLLYKELEETFLAIISTLPLSDSQELLQQCLSFATRNVDDCPHLVVAFNTWFRRANRQPQDDGAN